MSSGYYTFSSEFTFTETSSYRSFNRTKNQIYHHFCIAVINGIVVRRSLETGFWGMYTECAFFFEHLIIVAGLTPGRKV